MATQLQIRRGTTEQCDAFTGAEGEIIFDTTKKSLRLHDGITAGGRAIPTFTGEIPSGGDYVVESQLPTSENNYTWYRLYNSGWVEVGGYVAATSTEVKTVTLPITMADNLYNVTLGGVLSGNGGSGCQSYNLGARTTTTIVIYSDYVTTNTGVGCFWEVKGIAVA